ncbi:hypothetical protein GALMADRAFT_216453 [Galerina marginata CBS 339.88]|uniref:Uncharacterized protein n=1 Tax=Galerina marginata (strain CBS 339.88) TaxID=685588 RepID=A0A067SKQ5_GALM3|nr:hypothetical protein GALMADRAFT_216453 [Galerina marginata CBS 339.88]
MKRWIIPYVSQFAESESEPKKGGVKSGNTGIQVERGVERGRCPRVDSLSREVVKFREQYGNWDRLTSIYAHDQLHDQDREAIQADFHDEQYVRRRQNTNTLSLNELEIVGDKVSDVELDDTQPPLVNSERANEGDFSGKNGFVRLGFQSWLKTPSYCSLEIAVSLGPKLAPFNTDPSTPSTPDPARWKFAADSQAGHGGETVVRQNTCRVDGSIIFNWRKTG